MSEEDEHIANAIAKWMGDRCPDFEPDCACCKTWARYDALRSARRSALMEAVEVAGSFGWDLDAAPWEAQDAIVEAIRSLAEEEKE